MKKYLILVSAVFLLFACSQSEKPMTTQNDRERSVSIEFFSGEIGEITNSENNIESKSDLDYILEINNGENNVLGGEYKKYVQSIEKGKRSIEEWIRFDSLNRVRTMHFAQVNTKNLLKDFELEGTLHSTLMFEEMIVLVAQDSEVVFLEEISDPTFRVHLNRGLSLKNINIQIITTRRDKQSGSIALQTIHKRFGMKDGKLKELMYNPQNEETNFAETVVNFVKAL